MRPILALAALLAVSGCAGSGPASDVPAAPGDDPSVCGADRLQAFVGGPLSPAQQAAGQAITRVYAEGDAITMDFLPERLNFVTDGAGTVVAIRCG